MIPQSFIDAWRESAPWSSDLQVEQDLVVSRAVAELFADADLHELLAMRGGTVLNKFFFGEGSRYSEDIDLVKVGTGKAGPFFDIIRKRLDPWLGSPKSEISDASIKLIYRFTSEADPAVKMRLKVEVNTRENFSVLGYQSLPFEVNSGWFSNKVHVKTFALNELLGTKILVLAFHTHQMIDAPFFKAPEHIYLMFNTRFATNVLVVFDGATTRLLT